MPAERLKQLFYTPDIGGEYCVLPATESNHCIRTLRMGLHSELFLTDGKGTLFSARIIDPHPGKCVVEITHSEIRNKPIEAYIHLAVAPTKNISRFEWFLEKATEIGIDEITPLICRNSERKTIKTDRLNQVLIAAMKQSLKTWLPVLNQPITFDRLIRQSYEAMKFIAWISNDEQRQLHQVYKKGRPVVILIGPEGDFTMDEAQKAINLGYVSVVLGPSRLRTETAAITACHTLNLLNW